MKVNRSRTVAGAKLAVIPSCDLARIRGGTWNRPQDDPSGGSGPGPQPQPQKQPEIIVTPVG